MAVGGGIASAAVAVGTTAVQLVGGRSGRDTLIVQNIHATQILYVGPSGVSTADGLKVAAGQTLPLDNLNGPLYGIASGAGTDVRILEVF